MEKIKKKVGISKEEYLFSKNTQSPVPISAAYIDNTRVTAPFPKEQSWASLLKPESVPAKVIYGFLALIFILLLITLFVFGIIYFFRSVV